MYRICCDDVGKEIDKALIGGGGNLNSNAANLEANSVLSSLS